MIETPLRRLQLLLESVFDGAGTEDDRLAFTTLIEQHQELTPRVLEQLDIHSLLQWEFDQLQSRNLHLPPISETRGEEREFQHRISRVIRSLVVSFAVMLVAAMGTFTPLASDSPSIEFVAATRCAF
jgi:hypothetical protein